LKNERVSASPQQQQQRKGKMIDIQQHAFHEIGGREGWREGWREGRSEGHGYLHPL